MERLGDDQIKEIVDTNGECENWCMDDVFKMARELLELRNSIVTITEGDLSIKELSNEPGKIQYYPTITELQKRLAAAEKLISLLKTEGKSLWLYKGPMLFDGLKEALEAYDKVRNSGQDSGQNSGQTPAKEEP